MSYKGNLERSGERVSREFRGESLTVQSDKHGADINQIVGKFVKTGIMPNVKVGQPMFGDFVNVMNYQDALICVAHVEQQFDALPAHVRDRFKNSPSELIDFLSDADNRQEAVELGFAVEATDLPLEQPKAVREKFFEKESPQEGVTEPGAPDQAAPGEA